MTQTVQQSCLIVLAFLLLPCFTPQHLLLVGFLKSNATPYITVLKHAWNFYMYADAYKALQLYVYRHVCW